MNRSFKIMLFAAASAAVASTASAQYNSGDLILGFSKGATDVMFDLGSAASIGVGGGSTVDLSSRVSATLLNSSYANNLGSLAFGVVGENSSGPAGSQKFIYSTVVHGSPAPNNVPNVSSWNAISLNVDTAGSAIDGSGSPANSAVVDNTAGNGNSFLEAITSSSGNTFARNYGDPTTTTPATFTSGFAVEDLYGASANNAVPLFLGTLTIGSDATVSFTAVPEPTTCGLLAVGGLLALGMRRRSARKV